jgi:RimJ/RimL family protein N-acetyltransferase
VGYGLGSAFRGQGYATEAVRALLDHGLRVVGLRRIWAVTDRENVGSARLMRRVGMVTAANPDREAVWPGVVGLLEPPAQPLPG